MPVHVAVIHSVPSLCYSVVWVHLNVLIHSPVERYLGCSWGIFGITSNTAANIQVCVFWCMGARFSLGNTLKVEWHALGVWLMDFYFIDHGSITHPCARHDLTVTGEHVDS